MSQPEFRCEGDADLQQKLLEEEAVQRMRRHLEENPSGSVRRRLLATSLRLTESMSPRLHRMLHDAAAKLAMTEPIETYVYNSPNFNAACVKPDDERVLLMFSSSLLEKFNETELLFVMGHELGHHLFDHHAIPIGNLVNGKGRVGPALALKLFSWSRYAEISADRAGALCAGDADGAAGALFKLASGLTTDLIEIHIDEFAAQADEMDLEDTPRTADKQQDDWFLTHPFTPLRVKALQAFFQSDLVVSDGMSRSQLEAKSHELMAMMSPTYLEEKSDEAEIMRRVLFAAGCGLMRVTGEITKEEIAAFDQLFGDGTFGDHLDIDALEDLLDKRIDKAKEVCPLARRAHIVRDLCLIAVADGHVSEAERRYVHRVGKRLELSFQMIEHCLSRDAELD